MPAAIFDGLAEIFTDPSVFGEAVVYVPLATGLPVSGVGAGEGQVNAIWSEEPLQTDMLNAADDARRSQLTVNAADIDPQEGDIATRVADGKVMKVSTPIRPDGKGLIVCNLVDCE